jgi:hypothetical protein
MLCTVANGMANPSHTQAGQKYEGPVSDQTTVTLRPIVMARAARRQTSRRRRHRFDGAVRGTGGWLDDDCTLTV